MKKISFLALALCGFAHLQAISLLKPISRLVIPGIVYALGTNVANNGNSDRMNEAFKKDGKWILHLSARSCNEISKIAGYYQPTQADMIISKVEESKLRHALTLLKNASLEVVQASSQTAAVWFTERNQQIRANVQARCASDALQALWTTFTPPTEEPEKN